MAPDERHRQHAAQLLPQRQQPKKAQISSQTVDDVGVLHPHPGSKHATVRAAKRNDGAVLPAPRGWRINTRNGELSNRG